MTKIECLIGATEQTITGQTYDFVQDEHGRFVCDVDNDAHVECFLARSDVYRRAGDAKPVVPAAAPVKPVEPEVDEDDPAEIEEADDTEEVEETEDQTDETDEAGEDDEDAASGTGDGPVDIEKMTDTDLRDAILDMTGKMPAASCKRATLVKRYNDAAAAGNGD